MSTVTSKKATKATSKAKQTTVKTLTNNPTKKPTKAKPAKLPFALTKRGLAYGKDKENRLSLNALVNSLKTKGDLESYIKPRLKSLSYAQLCNKGNLILFFETIDNTGEYKHNILTNTKGERKTTFKGMIHLIDRIVKHESKCIAAIEQRNIAAQKKRAQNN